MHRSACSKGRSAGIAPRAARFVSASEVDGVCVYYCRTYDKDGVLLFVFSVVAETVGCRKGVDSVVRLR